MGGLDGDDGRMHIYYTISKGEGSMERGMGL